MLCRIISIIQALDHLDERLMITFCIKYNQCYRAKKRFKMKRLGYRLLDAHLFILVSAVICECDYNACL